MVADVVNRLFPKAVSGDGKKKPLHGDTRQGILFLTSYPPRECGIATYSHDLIKAINDKFSNEFSIKVCALESGVMDYAYPDEVKYIFNTNDTLKYGELARTINNDRSIQLVLVQHEFGFFYNAGKDAFLSFLDALAKPVITIFHTVRPHPDSSMKTKVMHIASACGSVVVMTQNSAKILRDDYDVADHKISVIAHGTHLVQHLNKKLLKEKYGLTGRKVLSIFGLLSSGKSIETALDALPAIIDENSDVTFLVIGKIHPGVIRSEGEKYRNMLEAKVNELNLQQHVKFINQYQPLPDLLEYLQLTDIYLFTSKDPHQAVSGTFAYALSCGCPVISTPIPHAREVLGEDTGVIIDFENPQQLANAVNRLLHDQPLRRSFSSNALQRMVPTAWENSAIAHALLLKRIIGQYNGKHEKDPLQYQLPVFNLEHCRKMTTDFGMIQFSKIDQPDIASGYTLDDNARALIAMCMHYELTVDEQDLPYMHTYLDFIKFCQQPEGYFLNYVDKDQKFTEQNQATNLADANGRTVWALGYIISKRALLPPALLATAEDHATGIATNREGAFHTSNGIYDQRAVLLQP